MRINVQKVSITPKEIEEECCVFVMDREIENWINFHNLHTTKHPKGYYNISLEGKDILSLFNTKLPYKFLDGFSPNLNKELHLGHLSNLVYASALQSLLGINTVAILNDTDDHSKKDIYLQEYYGFCEMFNYPIDKTFFSSKMELSAGKEILDGSYKGCISLCINGEEKILYKSNGESTYLCQDLSFAKLVDEPIIYLTGSEQISHFELVTSIFPENKHLPIGLITTDKEKMSSRKGNVVLLKDIVEEYPINTLKDTFLKYNLKSFKDNIKIEDGLSIHLNDDYANSFDNKKLYLVYLKAYQNLDPSYLYNSLKKESTNDINLGLRYLGY